MRGVSSGASRVAPLLAVFLVFVVAGAWADEPPAGPPTDSPQARMSPPVGVSTQARVAPPVGIAPPPPPDATTQARANPPVRALTRGQVSLFDMMLMWLQSRISIPNG
jgi:hypothetical protein